MPRKKHLARKKAAKLWRELNLTSITQEFADELGYAANMETGR